VGDGINRANLLDIACNGKGMALFNMGGTNTTSNIETLLKSVGTPGIRQIETNLSFKPPVTKTVSLLAGEAVPKDTRVNLVTDYPVIADHFYTAYAILDASHDQKSFVLTGKTEDANIYTEIEFTDLPPQFNVDALGCLIAKRVIQQNDNVDRDVLIRLACDFNIMTKYTSLVAVSEKVVVDPATVPTMPTVVDHGNEALMSALMRRSKHVDRSAVLADETIGSLQLQSESLRNESVRHITPASGRVSYLRAPPAPAAAAAMAMAMPASASVVYETAGSFGPIEKCYAPASASAPASAPARGFASAMAGGASAVLNSFTSFISPRSAASPKLHEDKKEEKKEDDDADMAGALFDGVDEADEADEFGAAPWPSTTKKSSKKSLKSSAPKEADITNTIPTFKFSFEDLMNKYFDVSTGLCKSSVVTMIPIIPFKLLSNPMALTKYMLLLVKANCSDEDYKQFFAVIAAGGSFTKDEMDDFRVTYITTTLKNKVYQECGL